MRRSRRSPPSSSRSMSPYSLSPVLRFSGRTSSLAGGSAPSSGFVLEPIKMKTSVKLALALLAFAVVGTAIGIVARLPYQFSGVGDAARVSEDFLSKGTAVSPPIVALVILIVAIAVALQRGLVGRVGSGL